MAENENTGAKGAEDKGAKGAEDKAPQAGVIAQYIKDLSFENPNAPGVFQTLQNNQPKIDVNVNVNGGQVSEDVFEVVLNISVTALGEEDQKNFVCELSYAGLFGLRNIPEDALGPFMLVQAPTILFPYARRIISDATRDGGFPPLMLEPIDFMTLYQQQADASANAPEPGKAN
jgi:preprotein translocase subunit SecB